MLSIAVPAGLLIGVLLGALGGGGSILTVPVLVYLLGQEPHAATTGALLIVGITAAAGMIAHWRAGRVRLAPGIAFGVLGVAGSYAGTRLSSSVPPDLLLSLFAGLLLAAAAARIFTNAPSGGGLLRRRGTRAGVTPLPRPPVSVQAYQVGNRPGRPGGGLARGSEDHRRGHGRRPAHRLLRRGGRVRHRARASCSSSASTCPRAGGPRCWSSDQQRRRARRPSQAAGRPGQPRLGTARRVHRCRAGRGAGRQPRRVPGRRVPAQHRLHRPAHRRGRLLARPQPAWADVTGSGACRRADHGNRLVTAGHGREGRATLASPGSADGRFFTCQDPGACGSLAFGRR